jgi:hypothetical protein
MQKREGLKKTAKPRSTALFDTIKDIKYGKKGNLFDEENSEYEAAFSNFMALRFLSMKQELCPLLNIVNQFQDSIDKKDMYKLLVELVPNSYEHDEFIKAIVNKYEYEKDVAQYFECSLKEAREYIDIMGLEWAKEIHSSYGGQND